MVIDLSNSSVTLAVEQLAKEKNRIAIANAVGTTDFTGQACTATAASWLYDSYGLTTNLARQMLKQGLPEPNSHAHVRCASIIGMVLRGGNAPDHGIPSRLGQSGRVGNF